MFLKPYLYLSAVVPKNKTSSEIPGIAVLPFSWIWLNGLMSGGTGPSIFTPTFADPVAAGLKLLNHTLSFEGEQQKHNTGYKE